MDRNEFAGAEPPAKMSRRNMVNSIGGGVLAAIGATPSHVAPNGASGAAAAAGPGGPSECPGPPLEISPSEVSSRLRSLYTTMLGDSQLQARFIQNPSSVLVQYGMASSITYEAASAANRLLFSILSNPAFREWLRSYAAQHLGTRLDSRQAAQDLTVAIRDFGDPNLISAMVESATVGQPIPGGGFGPLANQLLVNNASGTTVVTPVSSPSTSNQTIHSSSNFDGTGESLGGPSVISSALLRTLAEQLTTRAQQLSSAGTLSDLRTRIF
ncbi:hypothetical protein [Sphaerisporangium corydalis]|uniref:Uncharacterized protein n=1 Tax=Sphaerisporangium corydalis TaxID=1441875 RepID=A0ABV9EPL1_9ACTN|nr:hypothetical protein [Sphaerisporangium corydalis]